METIRQGDKLLIPVDKLPKNLMELPTQILARGETTDHKHQFNGQTLLYAQKNSVTMEPEYVVVKKQDVLSHEEHAELEIPAGIYKVETEREFDISSELEQTVRD